METKESLIEKIDFCETVLKTMIELEDNIKKLKEKELELQKEHKDIVDEGPWDRGTLIFYCVFVGLLCAGVGLIATVIIGLFTASWKSFIIYGAAALGVMAMIWRQKDAIEKSKFEIPTKLAENERKLEEIAEEIKEAQRKSDEYLDSDDFSKAMEFIPHDYFYIAAMEKFKMEAASQVGVNLKQGYNGDLTSREAGSIGGQMVKKMIEAYENSMK